MESVNKKGGNFSKSERKWDLEYFCEIGMILQLTEFEIVLEYFYEIEVRIKLFLSEEEREEKLDLENFLSEKAKGKKGVGLKRICPGKREEESKVKQVRRAVRSPVR